MEGGKLDGNLGIFLSWAVEGFVLFRSRSGVKQRGKAVVLLWRATKNRVYEILGQADAGDVSIGKRRSGCLWANRGGAGCDL